MKRLYWLSLILIFLAAACAGPTAVEPAISTGSGQTVSTTAENDAVAYTDDEAGFSITLPAGWTIAEASDEAFAQMRSTIGVDNVLTDAYVQALLASGLQLYALNEAAPSIGSDVPVSIQIIRRDAPTSLSLDEYVADTTKQLEDILELTSPLEQSTVMLGGDEAVQLRYTKQAQTAAGSKAEVHNTQYYLMNGSDLYIITLEMEQGLVADYLAAGETAVETFQLTTGG